MAALFAPFSAALTLPPPWLSPYLPLARQVAAMLSSQSVAAALNAASTEVQGRFCFDEQSALPAGEPYETFIARTHRIPTRENPHDLFNGLVWLRFPQTKQRLNALQAQQIMRHGTSGPRGALRDALTLFDENAAVLQAPSALIDALRLRDWNTLFVAQRTLWQSARLLVFGHALLEKLLQPRKPITAHVWVVEELTDDALASSLTPERFAPQQLAAKAFLPLPILGVPGWWPANEEPEFYDDPDVFRQPR